MNALSNKISLFIDENPLSKQYGIYEGGSYLTKVPQKKGIPYDYIAFHDLARAVFEYRYNNLYELVVVRQPDPDMEHIFSIVGRTDDYVYLSNGDGLHASLPEMEIEAHPAVRAALIKGQGRPAPVLIVQLFGEYESGNREEMADSLWSYIEKVNLRCHDRVKLSRLFEGDQDLDISSVLPRSVGIETEWEHTMSQTVHQADKLAPNEMREVYKTPKYAYDLANIIVPYVRQKLDTKDLGHAIFAASVTRESEPTDSTDDKYRTITVGALMMRVGARIKPEDLQHLRDLVPQIPCHDRFASPLIDEGSRGPGCAQLLAALDHYQAGVPRSFQEPRSNRTLDMPFAYVEDASASGTVTRIARAPTGTSHA
ncbi:hypothetical protein BDV27DRAFT_153311 [Aspergillus caelatus]|uniref:Uncharacterized protein n=1 Tax=Aspergillus caelatus TaxID=61420 RepID=A0A5N7AHK4_9EURO|nr:uncharacterized protein BDV27DRAFT_153311 [Aspergillus caelatus]KAE8369235.1 hypothetical protein BDV27DRAFT_153311 [Aspergillus caelatus]